MQTIVQNLSDCARSISKSEVKFESRSTLDGNQARIDIVFGSESEAREFNLEVNRTKTLSAVKVAMRTFLFYEVELDYEQDPVLTEQDVLHIVKFDRLRNLFRHFLTCNVITEDNKIVFRFNTIADVNLFLYNKCRDPNKRTIGKFRQDQEQLSLLPGKNEKFSLVVYHSKMKSWDWELLENKFKFKQKMLGGVKHVQFDNKIDLYTFFASEDAKNFDTLEVLPAQLIEDNLKNNPKLHVEKALADDDQDDRLQLAAVEKELIAAKVDLAKKDAIFDKQRTIIKELRKEIEVKLIKKQ